MHIVVRLGTVVLLLAHLASSALFAQTGEASDAHLDRELRDAAIVGDTVLIETLLRDGVNANAKTRFGKSALMFAAEEGNQVSVELLLDRVPGDLAGMIGPRGSNL